ncbi:VOC family protein [Ramlibacter sp.]|uniref:VOC family protein n=1 Tax=Ramlibacter sp. TaxID=1917967 RepID=UPI002FCB9D22
MRLHPASDLARARQFYEGKLGLRPKEVHEGGVAYAFGGGTACFLYLTPNAGTREAQGPGSGVFKDSEGNIMALIEEVPGS